MAQRWVWLGSCGTDLYCAFLLGLKAQIQYFIPEILWEGDQTALLQLVTGRGSSQTQARKDEDPD